MHLSPISISKSLKLWQNWPWVADSAEGRAVDLKNTTGNVAGAVVMWAMWVWVAIDPIPA